MIASLLVQSLKLVAKILIKMEKSKRQIFAKLLVTKNQNLIAFQLLDKSLFASILSRPDPKAKQTHQATYPFNNNKPKSQKMSVKQRNVTIERGVKISHGGVDGDFSKQAVHHIKGMNDKREHEKQELQVLNQRFSSYVERVRALEAMNRKLLAGIEDLKSKWGFDSSKIKDEMEPELLRVRESIDEVTRLKAIAEIKAKRAESDALQFRHLMDLAMDCFNSDKNKIQNLERLMENTKQDAEYLKGQLHDINEQIAKYVDEQRRLFDQLSQLKDDLDKETIDRGKLERPFCGRLVIK
jgi:hypothetical protein